MQARNQLLGMAAQDPNLVRVRPNGMEDTPQLDIKIDYEKALAQGSPSPTSTTPCRLPGAPPM